MLVTLLGDVGAIIEVSDGQIARHPYLVPNLDSVIRIAVNVGHGLLDNTAFGRLAGKKNHGG